MISDAVLDALLANGASAEMIVAVVKADFAESETRRANKREKDAERQRRKRRRDRHGESRVTERDETDAPPKDINQTPLTSETSVSKVSKRAPKKLVSVELPDWLPPEAWQAFVTMRKAMRGVPFTDDAAKGIIGDLDKLRGQGHDPEKLLMKAVKRGWRGVFEADDTLGSTKGPLRNYEPTTPDECERSAKFWETQGADGEAKAKELRHRATALRSKPPDPAVAGIVSQVTRSLTQPTGGPH